MKYYNISNIISNVRISPIVNSNGTGTVNFVVNICPTGNTDIKILTKVKSESNDHDSLLEGIDVDDLFSDI